MKEVERKVIDQLMRLEVLFDKVAILCRAIGRYGLFCLNPLKRVKFISI